MTDNNDTTTLQVTTRALSEISSYFSRLDAGLDKLLTVGGPSLRPCFYLSHHSSLSGRSPRTGLRRARTGDALFAPVGGIQVCQRFRPNSSSEWTPGYR